MKSHRIDAIVTCVDCSDVLQVTLPKMTAQIDHVTVVTSPGDKDTQELCRRYGVDFIATDSFYRIGAPFNKGMAINIAMANVKYNDWILYLDCDIALPNNFKSQLELENKRFDFIYGAQRMDVIGYDQYERVVALGLLDALYWEGDDTPYPKMIDCWDGYSSWGEPATWAQRIPVGFFQLCHYSYMRHRHIEYPKMQPTAADSDVDFANLWPRENRKIIEDAVVYHLSSETVPMGADWEGRKTKKFL